MRKTTIALALALLANVVVAATPENGWWWNPQEPGSGYNIETQNNTVFISTFVYDEAGNPVWYSGAGKLTNDRVTMDLLRSEGGPCLGCGFTSAQSFQSGYLLTATFESPSKATLSINGDQSQIERFNFDYGLGAHRLLGTWSIVLRPPSNTLGVSDTVAYHSITGNDAIGFRSSDPGTPVVAKMLEGGETYLSIIPISMDENLVLFFFFHGFNRIQGLTAIVESNANSDEIFSMLANDGVLTIGFRYLPPPTDMAETASVKQVPNSNSEADYPCNAGDA